MANPYPADFADDTGQVRLGGEITFTDQANQPGGGSVPGAVITRKFPIAFNTAGLLTGKTLWTPAIGDILLDGWFEIITAWDGTTPSGDIGTFVAPNGPFGLYGDAASPVDMTIPDTLGIDSSILTGQTGSGKSVALSLLATNGRIIPGKFVIANPVKVCVSQNGTITGADPGSTAGAGIVYLVTSTPA